MIALHCGYTEDQINEISYIFYKDLLSEIQLDLQYTASVNLLSKDYADEKVSDYVEKSNPFFVDLNEYKSNKKSSNTTEKLTMSKLKNLGIQISNSSFCKL
jgi:tRNA G26 N,N-dimethylase Trm1